MPNRLADAFPPWNFSWVVPNRVAGMACPLKRENLKFVVNSGIKHLITLSPEMKPEYIHEFADIERTEFPVEEFEAPSLECITKFVELCQQCQLKEEAVGVHCRQGLGRTGTLLACYLMVQQDLTPQRAITNIRIMRPGSIETWEQENAIKMYHDHLRKE